MTTLSEDDIKRMVLAFLRGYYKFRPKGSIQASLDMRGQGGVVADGYISFEQEDGRIFTATFEATSADTREEVRFRRQTGLLSWDSLVFAVWGSTVFFIWSHQEAFASIPDVSVVFRLMELILAGTILFFLFRVISRNRHRYRHIYAIAQFKQYHADEQWIAISRDVFPRLERSKYYQELKGQCIYHGFGLILVEPNLQPKLVVTPTRQQDAFSLSRRSIQFFSLPEISLRLRRRRTDAESSGPALGWRTWLRPYFTRRKFRFRRSYFHQIVLCTIGLLLSSYILVLELRRLPIREVNASFYQRVMEHIANTLKTERTDEDTAQFIIPFGPLPPDTLWEEVQGVKPALPGNDFPLSYPDTSQVGVVMTEPGSNAFVFYDCERLYTFDTVKFIVEYGLFPDLNAATEAAGELTRSGEQAGALWEGCFSPDSKAYIVFFDPILNDSLDALRYAQYLNKKLLRTDSRAKVRVRKIFPAER